MMEKSSIDILTDFAKKHNYKYWSEVRPNESILPHRGKLINTKFFVLTYPKGSYSYYFCASDNGANSCYSGLYGNYSTQKTAELSLVPKSWIDRFLFKNIKKSGISSLDKKVTITCTSDSLVKMVVSPRMGDEFVSLSKKISPIEFVIEENDLIFNAEINSESVMGIKANRWIIDEKELKLILQHGSKILDMAKKLNQ